MSLGVNPSNSNASNSSLSASFSTASLSGVVIEGQPELVSDTITNYALAVFCGNNYVYSALPRLLTVWLDAEERMVQQKS
jgi:hypothetical protein